MNIGLEIRGIDHMRRLAGTFRQPALRALNKTARSTEAFANRSIRQTYNITRAEADKGIHFRPGSISRLTAILTARGPRLPLFKFIFGSKNPRTLRRREGPTVQVVRGQRKLLKGAFVQTMRSGHVGIFVRKESARLPIEEKKTLSVAGMLGARKISKSVREFFKATLPGVFKHELNFWYSKQ